MAKLGVVIVARLLDLALQGLVGHLARGIAVVSNLARFRSVAEGERLLPQAITNELVHGGHDERDGGAHAPGRELCRLACAVDLSRGSLAAAIFLVRKPPPPWR